jgi:twitching motility protein PilT
MVGTGLIRDCIREAEKTTQIPAVMAAGAAQYGMQTFDQSLLLLYRQEMITYETARDAATNPDDFDLKVKGIFSAGEMTYETSKKPEETAKVPGLTGTSTPTAPAPAPSAPRPGGTGGSSFFKRS